MIVPMVSAGFIEIADANVIELFLALPIRDRQVPARAVVQRCESLAHLQTSAARATWSEKPIVRSLRNSELVDGTLVERTLARPPESAQSDSRRQPAPICLNKCGVDEALFMSE
ncbi:hypothetical protein [Burkholderia multivorans]|uniref:hypothetical protein n=1 Tax=Burkholderia multivorans TaxID=87883 RepID=UPI001E4F564F|nr:hypothetical protein [Burkholderia multivorans]